MIDFEEQKIVDAYDDFPFWSAAPGLVLLENFKYEKYKNILDIGCGTGFPAIEVAQRCGETCVIYGIDIWEKGIKKAREKAENKDVKNVIFNNGNSQRLPFENKKFDKIISNNAFNGKNGSLQIFSECNRVLKEKGELYFTAILPSSMKNFYNILASFIGNDKVKQYIKSKRLKISEYKENVNKAGFDITNIKKFNFKIKFADEKAFYKYHFFKMNFIDEWIDLIKEKNIIEHTKDKIKEEIEQKGEFIINIDCVYILGIKR